MFNHTKNRNKQRIIAILNYLREKLNLKYLLIVEMALNGSGVRDTARVLKVSTSTVTRELKKIARN